MHRRATRIRTKSLTTRAGTRRAVPLMTHNPEVEMLRWALIFFVLALIAALFGYGGIAAGAAGIAKILFFAFLVLAAIAIVANLARGRAI